MKVISLVLSSVLFVSIAVFHGSIATAESVVSGSRHERTLKKKKTKKKKSSPSTVVLYKTSGNSTIGEGDELEPVGFTLIDLGVVEGDKYYPTSALVEASVTVGVTVELTNIDYYCTDAYSVAIGGVGLSIRAFSNCDSAEECGATIDSDPNDFETLIPGFVPLVLTGHQLNTAYESSVAYDNLLYVTNKASFVLPNQAPGDFFLQASVAAFANSTVAEFSCYTRKLLDSSVSVFVDNFVISVNKEVITKEITDVNYYF